MKRTIAFLLSLASVLTFASCKKEPTEEKAPPTYSIEKYTEDIVWEGIDIGDISLLYPKLDMMEEASKLLFDMIKQKCNESLPNLSSYEGGDLPEVTYEIDKISVTYLSDTFLSAVVEGMLTVSLAAHPNPFIYAINVDLEECREISSGEMLADFDKIKKLFVDGRFTLVKGLEDVGEQMSFEDMIMQYRSEYEIYPQIYFSADKLYMNIELVYALGGNAVYSIELDDVKNCLSDNKEISKITEQRKK